MFTKPPLLPVYAGVVSVLVIFGVVVGPVPDWWSVYLPRAVAASFRMCEAPYLVRTDPCGAGAMDDLKQLLADPRAQFWFATIRREAITPAGRLYGLIGTQVLDSAAFETEVAKLSPVRQLEVVDVLDSDSVRRVRVGDLVVQVRAGAFRRLLNAQTKRPEC
jgi:hypothetical protein